MAKPTPAQDLALSMLRGINRTPGQKTAQIESRDLQVLTDAINADRAAVVAFYRQAFAAMLKAQGILPSSCSSCGRQIWFVRTAAGKSAPYTADGISHFADCRTAAQHRGPRG